MPETFDGRPIKSFEQVQLEKQVREQLLAQQAAERKQQLDYFAQIEAQRNAEQAERDKEHQLFMQRVEYSREHPRAFDRTSIQPLDSLYQETLSKQQAADEQAEAARQAALTPHDLWVSTLPWTERQKVVKWEQINHRPYPVTGPQAQEKA